MGQPVTSKTLNPKVAVTQQNEEKNKKKGNSKDTVESRNQENVVIFTRAQ